MSSRIMENRENMDYNIPRATLSKDVFPNVKQRMIQSRIKAAKTQRQIAVGASLLLILGVFNIGIAVFYDKAVKNAQTDPVQSLHDAYFKTNQNSFFNE
ncbi:MAG: hypothetical protein JNL70_08415 [Saprospiraceae bacterium]|nr:hypothetical protein [Saprospiraceae bacterium]